MKNVIALLKILNFSKNTTRFGFLGNNLHSSPVNVFQRSCLYEGRFAISCTANMVCWMQRC